VTDAGLFVFDQSFRPIPLSQIFVGVTARPAVIDSPTHVNDSPTHVSDSPTHVSMGISPEWPGIKDLPKLTNERQSWHFISLWGSHFTTQLNFRHSIRCHRVTACGVITLNPRP